LTIAQTIHRRFKSFDKEMRDIWESYELIQYLSQTHHDLIKAAQKRTPGKHVFVRSTLYGDRKDVSAQDAYGALSHLERKLNPRHALVDAVSAFEEYVGSIIELILLNDPELLKNETSVTEKEEIKLVNWIVDSNDKSEILERVIEERIRSLFYGNPVDALTKPKSKLRVNAYFSSPACQPHIERFAEIIARRNVIAHNDGHVDRKYLREVSGTSLTLGKKIPITGTYLQGSIGFLLCLAAKLTELVLRNHYKSNASGTLKRRLACCNSLPAI